MVTTAQKQATETYLYHPCPPEPGAVSVALAYPADYSVSMSSIGYLSLFRQLDENPMVDVNRISVDRLAGVNASQFELIGFSFSFELDILNILKTLDSLGLPFYSKDRSVEMPLVFAGGPVMMTNPEPYADFLDFVLIGEGEELLNELMDTWQTLRHIDNRQERLKVLAQQVKGVYVPSLYQVEYQGADKISAILPRDDAPYPVNKRWIEDMSDAIATSPILTADTIFSDKFIVEIMRGCAHRCRFCLASYSMLPARGPSYEKIVEAIEAGLEHTHQIGLMGALIANHPDFDQLCEYLNHKMDERPEIVISAASLRADTLTPEIAKVFQRGKQKQLTIAIESGSEKLRRRINKNLKQEAIFNAADAVSQAGMKGLKFYGMVGLPDETLEDIEATVQLMKDIKKAYPKLKLVLGCSSFVPKAATPFQWMERLDNKEIGKRFNLLKKGLLKVADFRPSSTKWDTVQAVLSRGDRRLAPVLVRYYQLGTSLGTFNRAYKEVMRENSTLPTMDCYANRQRHEEEILPWDVLHLGVDKASLYRESQPLIKA